jgi:transposase
LGLGGSTQPSFQRLAGEPDDPRSGVPRTITDDQAEALIVKTRRKGPGDATHFSTRSMAKEVGMSQTSIRRIWHTCGLQPHRAESFKLSTDPLLVEKARDIVGLSLASRAGHGALGRREVPDPDAQPL